MTVVHSMKGIPYAVTGWPCLPMLIYVYVCVSLFV